MFSNLKISVVMSCYNEPLIYLIKSIESILNQSLKNFEFIIILDNPKNKIIEKEILKYKKLDKRIIFIKNKKNLGLAESLNKGIKISRGKYIVRHDADDISNLNRLKIQFNYMEKNKKIDLLFSWVNYIDEKNKFIKSFEPLKYKIQNIKNYYFKEHLLVHPSLCSKSEILKKNLYDVKQKRSQDFELWIRLISKNYNFDIINKHLVNYRIFNEIKLEDRIKKVKNFNKYSLIAIKKNYSRKKIFLNFNKFYYKSLLLNYLLKLPIKFIKIIVLIKDRLSKNG